MREDLVVAVLKLKKKWDGTPITRGTLLAMLKEAYSFGFKMAIVFAKKSQSMYKKNSLLVYKKEPIVVFNPNSLFDSFGKLFSMYIALPNETPPEDVEIRPNSECEYNEQEIPLENSKELGERIVKIIKGLETSYLPKRDLIPKAPPSENYMYFFDNEDPEKFNPTVPINFIMPSAFENTYKSAGWSGSVGGVQIQPVDPHSDCYYQLMCCGSKPAPDARAVIKHYFKKRGVSTFNVKKILGIINPLFFLASRQTLNHPMSPPFIRLPLYPVPGPGRYPVPTIRVPGYRIDLNTKPQNPIKAKPLTTGRRGGNTHLGGTAFESMRSYEMNKKSYAAGASNTVQSGNGLNTRKKARTNAYNRGAWYNNQGVLGSQISLTSKGGKARLVIDRTDSSGLIPTNDIGVIQVDLPTDRTGLGSGRYRIPLFQESSNILKTYGYYFSDPLSPPMDMSFGSVATRQYQDNAFFYPYDNKFGRDTYIDFFVCFTGNGVHDAFSATALTDFYFTIIGQNDTAQPVFIDTLGTGKQSIGIANNANHVILEALLRYENIDPNSGVLSFQLRAVDGTGVVLTAPAITAINTNSITRGQPVHVKLRLTTSDLGTAAAQSVISNNIIVGGHRHSLGNFTTALGASNINRFNRIAFGYIDYDAPALAIPSLSGRLPVLSCNAGLTGLQFSNRPVARKFVWDYSRMV